MKQRNQENILFGACDVYVLDLGEHDKMPAYMEIEKPENKVAHTQGGTTIEYTPEKHEIKNDYGAVVKVITKEDAVAVNFGILQWESKFLSQMSTAELIEGDYDVSTGEFTEKKGGNVERLKFGGRSALPNTIIHLVHTKDNGAKLRFSMVGQGGDGFAIEFGEDEVVVDASFQAVQAFDGFLAVLDMEKEPAAAEAARLKGLEDKATK